MKIKKCSMCGKDFETLSNRAKLCSDECKMKNIYILNRKYQSKFNKYVVYQIKCKDTNVREVYIGSTFNLNQRVMKHRTRCLNQNDPAYNTFLYQFIRQNGGFDNFVFNVLEEFEDKQKMKIAERHHIDKNNLNLNSHLPLRDAKEWYNDNKDHCKDWYLKYYEQNKDKKALYAQQNKEKIKQKTKERNQINKNRYICNECDFSTHCKSKYHIHIQSKRHLSKNITF